MHNSFLQEDSNDLRDLRIYGASEKSYDYYKENRMSSHFYIIVCGLFPQTMPAFFSLSTILVRTARLRFSLLYFGKSMLRHIYIEIETVHIKGYRRYIERCILNSYLEVGVGWKLANNCSISKHQGASISIYWYLHRKKRVMSPAV